MAICSPTVREEVEKHMRKMAIETDTELMYGRKHPASHTFKFVFGDQNTHEKIAEFILDYDDVEDIFEYMSYVKEELHNRVVAHNACFGGFTYITKTKSLKELEREYIEYCKNDVMNVESLYPKLIYTAARGNGKSMRDADKLFTNMMFGAYGRLTRTYASGQTIPEIEDVIFNDPATIVFWNDGTKTVVKAQDDDVFDPEKGLAMAIAKKAFGNEGNYCNKLKTWLEVCEEKPDSRDNMIQKVRLKLLEAMNSRMTKDEMRYYINKAIHMLGDCKKRKG